VTPSKLNNPIVADTKVMKRKKAQNTQKHDYKNDQQNGRGHVERD
jgi:hypothetical protein